jgi:hypothetical protein
MRIPLGHLFASDPVLLLYLPLYFLLCMHALLVDLVSLFLGQSELGGCRLGVYGGWGCGSQATGGGGFLSVLLYAFSALCPLSTLPFVLSPICPLLASPSLTLSFLPIGFVRCKPLGLFSSGLLADRSEFLRGDP